MRAYDVSFSLGDGCAASIAMQTMMLNSANWKLWVNLRTVAWKHDCQVMIEGPGHVPMHMIKENMDLQLKTYP